MEDRVARVYRFKKVLKYSILSLIITIIGLLVFEYFRIKPNNVYFTNITSSSVTVSWDTKVKTDATAIYVEPENKLPFLILPIFKEKFFDTRDMTKAELEAAQQSSQNQEGLEVTMNEMVTNVSVTDRGRYYTHHVEIKGLDPEKEYSFMVGDSIVFRKVKDVNNETIAKTYAIPENLRTPVPAYGTVKNANGIDDLPINELPPVKDGIVYFAYYDEVIKKYSNMFSSPLNEVGSWYIDLSYAMDKDGNIFKETYFGSEDGLIADLYLDLGNLGHWKDQFNASAVSPTEHIVINSSKLIENSPKEVSSFLHSFTNKLINHSYAKPVECVDPSDCGPGATCKNNLCVSPSSPPPQPPEPECNGYKGCSGGLDCQDGECVADTGHENNNNTSGTTNNESSNNNSGSTSTSTQTTDDDDDDLEASEGYSEVCAELGYCECGMVESPGNKNLRKPCKGDALKNCEKKFTERRCEDYLPEQESKTCDGYKGDVAFGGVELHNGVCRVCGYKGSGSTRYVGWTNDNDNQYNPDNNCALRPEARNEKKGKSSFGEICKDGDGCVCNGDKNNITPFGEQCTIDNATEVALSNNCQAKGSNGKWDFQKNICVCQDDTYVKTSDKFLCYKITEEIDNSYVQDGIYIGYQAEDQNELFNQENAGEDLNNKYCWEYPFVNIQKCEEEKCYKCSNGEWKEIKNLNNNSCFKFVKTNDINSCEFTFFAPDCYKDGKRFSCTWAGIYEENTNTMTAGISMKEWEPSDGLCEDHCICISGAFKGAKIQSNQICPKVSECTPTNEGKTCYYFGDICEKGECIQPSKNNSSNPVERMDTHSNLLSKSKVIAQELGSESGKYIINQSTGLITNINSGSYYFENEGQTYFFDVSDGALAANNGGVLIYIDTNENGQYDEGTDTKVSTLGSQIEITTIQKNYKFKLEEGFNFVSFPFVVAYEEYNTAAKLLAQLNDVYGDVIYSISKFDGSWKVVGQNVEVYDNNDFQLVPGQGYVIKAKEDVEISIPGKPVKFESAEDSAPVSLFPGWNLIGIYGTNVKSYTAKSMLQDINAFETVDFTADNVSKWESDIQRYEGYQLTNENGIDIEYGFDYPINILQSYFVRVNAGTGNWQPLLKD